MLRALLRKNQSDPHGFEGRSLNVTPTRGLAIPDRVARQRCPTSASLDAPKFDRSWLPKQIDCLKCHSVETIRQVVSLETLRLVYYDYLHRFSVLILPH